MIQTIVVTLPGPQGVSGWTPVFALENADNRTLLHLTDWTGSNGNKPAVGYVGAAGLVTDPAQAINFAGRGITSVAQNEAADLIINYTDGTNATIPAYFAPMFAAAQQVADDASAVDETAEWIETTRQQMQTDKDTITQAKEDILNIFGNVEAIEQAKEDTEGYRDQAAASAASIVPWQPYGGLNITTLQSTDTFPPAGITFPLVVGQSNGVAVGRGFDITVPGTSTITGRSETFAVGDALVWRAGGYYRRPFGVDKNIPFSIKNLNLAVGKNLLDPDDADVKYGFYVNYSNGFADVNSSYNTTGWIPVTAGLQYAFGYKHQIAWYTSGKVYISGSNVTDANKIQTAPANAAFLRATIHKDLWGTIQIEQGNAITDFEPFGFKLDKVENRNTTAKRADWSFRASLADGLTLLARLRGQHMSYTKGKNLFNKTDPESVLGYFVSFQTGSLLANVSYNATHYIEVVAGQTYTVSYKHEIAWFDSRKQYISGTASSDVTKQQTAPAGAAYLRCTVAVGSWNTFQVELSNTQTSFESFRYFIDKLFGADVWAARALTARAADTASALLPTARLDYPTLGYVTGKNLFNPYDPDVLVDKYVFGTGGVGDNASYTLTGYIPVTAGQQYFISDKHWVEYYNSSKVFVSGDTTINASGAAVTIPAGAVFMRANIRDAGYNIFQIELGATKTKHEPYALYIDTHKSIPVKSKHIDPDWKATAPQLNYTVGKNLFNPNDPQVSIGNFVRSDLGSLQANAIYNATGYMPVTGGLNYSFSYRHQIAWYDVNQAYISGDNSSTTTLTAPANAAYCRATVSTGVWNTFQFEQSSAPTAYEPFAWYLDKVGAVPVYIKNVAAQATATGVIAPSIAPKLYVPRQREVSIYFENLHRNYDKEAQGSMEVVITPINATEAVHRSRRMKFKQQAGNTSLAALTATLRTYNDEQALVSSVNFAIQPVDETKNTAVKVLNLGDSFTGRMWKAKRLLQSSVGGTVTFLGMRKSTFDSFTVRHEGRGGFSMGSYHSFSHVSFMPFMQPGGSYKYYGNTDFWKLVFSSNNTDYIAGSMNDDILAYYDSATGLLKTPAVDDVMYDNTAATHKRWDGAAWVNVTGLTFTFNFAKYRSLYGTPLVDILHIMHGTNDFAGSAPSSMETGYATYKTRMDATIASFKADNPSGKIIIGIPVSSGHQGRWGTPTTKRRKIAYWYLAKSIHADYGNREAEGIYLADYHSTVDRRYGYDVSKEVPYELYTGTERDEFMADDVHLSVDGFNQMGDMYFGAIQACR